MENFKLDFATISAKAKELWSTSQYFRYGVYATAVLLVLAIVL
jgi:anti-sigma-K factor RskA